MINLNKLIPLIILIFLFLGCTEKISHSGKILEEDNIDYNSFNTKQDIIENLGFPSYIDPIENKYYYFTEKTIKKNFFDSKLDNRKLIVFNFNIDESINSLEEYDLSDQQKMKIISETTENNLLKKGLIENIFGGIGKGPTTTP